MALPNKPWSTNYPTSQDTVGVEQGDLTDDSSPGAEDGHRFLVAHVEALRDKLQAAAVRLGDNSNLPITSIGNLLDYDEVNGDAQQVRIRERGADPTAVANKAFIYAKDDAGTTKVYMRWSDGTVTLLGAAGSGNTLDGAYDQGGAGSGRAITVDSGPVQLTGTGVNAVLQITDGAERLDEIASDPTQVANGGLLYTKDVSSVTELFYRDSAGNVRQLTPAAGGGGTLDRDLIFSDDTEFTEASTYATKKTFRAVRDSAKAPSSWRLVVSLWITGGGTSAECRLQGIGSGGTDQATVTSTEVTETAASVKKIALTITANEPTDELLTINMQLQANGGGLAHMKYTDLYAIYT